MTMTRVTYNQGKRDNSLDKKSAVCVSKVRHMQRPNETQNDMYYRNYHLMIDYCFFVPKFTKLHEECPSHHDPITSVYKICSYFSDGIQKTNFLTILTNNQ